MQSLRLATAILALALVAAACGDDGEGEQDPVDEVTTTTGSTVPTTTQPRITTPTTEAPVTTETTSTTVTTPTSTTAPPETGISLGPPPPPSNVACEAGTAENELLVEFDALPNPSDISKIRVYVSVDGGPMITNGEYTVDEVDTTRADGTRWAARARRLPASVPLRLTATSFNQLGQESGWYIVEGLYAGPGAPCGVPQALPPTTCTAGCDEEEGEPGA